MQALGVALPMIAIEHPLGGERPDDVARRARQAVDQIATLLGKTTASATREIGRAKPASDSATGEIGRAEPASPAASAEIGRAEPASISLRLPSVGTGLTAPVTLDDDPEAVLAAFCERQWCDGLPIVPPTEARVRSEEPTSDLQSRGQLVCRLLLEKKKPPSRLQPGLKKNLCRLTMDCHRVFE